MQKQKRCVACVIKIGCNNKNNSCFQVINMSSMSITQSMLKQQTMNADDIKGQSDLPHMPLSVFTIPKENTLLMSRFWLRGCGESCEVSTRNGDAHRQHQQGEDDDNSGQTHGTRQVGH